MGFETRVVVKKIIKNVRKAGPCNRTAVGKGKNAKYMFLKLAAHYQQVLRFYPRVYFTNHYTSLQHNFSYKSLITEEGDVASRY